MNKIEVVRKNEGGTEVLIDGVHQQRVVGVRMDWDSALRQMVFVIKQDSTYPSDITEERMFKDFTLEYRTETIDDRMREAWAVDVVGPTAPSDITQSLIDQLRERDTKGREKYGTSLDRKDLSASDWLQHMTEELLDAAGYAQAAKREIERLRNIEKQAYEVVRLLQGVRCSEDGISALRSLCNVLTTHP